MKLENKSHHLRIATTMVRKFINPLSDSLIEIPRLLPTVCVVCGRSVVTAIALCEPCKKALPWINSACSKCGENNALSLQLGELCSGCYLSPPPFHHCRGLFHYRAPIDTLISGFKYHARFDIGHAFSYLLAIKIQEHYDSGEKPDVLLPVPLHPHRLRTRGYNQALEIAKVVESICKIPVNSSLAYRKKDTKPQTETRSASSRRKNLASAFEINHATSSESVRSIAIIDDVVTTMATISSLSNTLSEAGMKVVDVWCIARASG